MGIDKKKKKNFCILFKSSKNLMLFTINKKKNIYHKPNIN